ncbi:hypothetical protein ACLKA6_015893 [Drosophila palustris]
MVRTWIYNLKREELLQFGSEFKIELTGTVDAMRKEFGEWVEANEGHAPHAERLDALAKKHGRNSPFRTPVIQLENLDVNRTAASLAKMDFASTSEEAAVAKQVREWSFKFDGSSKPLEFLEQGTALKWYIANNEHWRTWASFVTSFHEFFLPRDYFSKLLVEVSRRKQGIDEPFKRYMVEMLTLMRPLRYSKECEREQIYTCSLPDFRAFARPYQNGSLIELMQLAEEFEELERDRERLRQNSRQNRSRLMAIEDSRQRQENIPCTRCAENDRARPQPTPRAFFGSPAHSNAADRETTVGVQLPAIIDTGATSSFVSEELAVTLVEEGFELGATQRQVRLADGRSSGVTEQVEVQIRLGNRQVDLALLVLPGVIDELVLGWDFLSTLGTILDCVGIQVRIPACRRRNKEQGERLSVANTLEQKAQEQLTQEPGSREHETPQQKNQEQRIQEQATTGEQKNAEEEEHTDNGEPSCKPLHSDAAIDQFLRQEIAAFASMTGTSPITERRIVMHDDRPIKQRYFPKNPKMQEEINKQVDELLAKGCIEPSNSPHSAPIVMVKKKTGKWRLCVDFRQLNSRSVKDAYPLPRVHHILDQLRETH